MKIVRNLINSIKYFITTIDLVKIINANIEPILFLFIYIVFSYFFSQLTNSNYSLTALTGDLTILLLCLIPYSLIKQKYRHSYIVIISIIISGSIGFYYLYYLAFEMFYGLTLSSTVNRDTIVSILNIRGIFFYIPVVLLILNKKYIQKQTSKYTSAYVIPLFIVCFFLTAINVTDIDVGRLRKLWNKEHIVDKFGIHFYIVNDLLWNIPSEISALYRDANAKNYVEDYFNQFDISVEANQYTGIFEGKNLIVIHAESLQSLPIFMRLENGNEVTPNLNRIINQNSLYFSNFYAQDGLGTSSDTEFTVNTSLLPTSQGTLALNYWDNNYSALPELLASQYGYNTCSMHGNHGNYWNRRLFHESLGFDYFYYEAKDFIINETIGLGLSDKSFFSQAIDKLITYDKQEEPYMSTLITLSSHSPFKNIIPYHDFDAGEYQGKAFGNYLTSINYLDQAIGQFFDDLEANGLLDNTVVVIYGDHDAQLRKKTYHPYYQNNPEDLYYIDGIFDETMTYQLNRKVPLIIYSKDIQANEITDVCGMYDLLPTLANMFNLKTSYTLGRDVFSDREPFVVLANGSWITNETYYYKNDDIVYYLKETFYSDELIEYYKNKAKQILAINNKIIENDLIEDP